MAQKRHLSASGGDLSGGVDIGAEKGLSENGDQAALGLLATLSAGVDEGVDGGGGDGRRSAVQVGEVENVSCAADGIAGAAETDLTLLERGSEGRDGESEDGGVEHVDGLGLVVGWFGWSVD